MGKQWTSGRTKVELRPSRIRREPPAPAPSAKPQKLNAYPTADETRAVVIGVILFALAFAIITIGFSDFTSK